MARYFGVPLRNGLPIGLGSSIGLGGAGGPPAPIPDDYFEYTTLLLPGNGTNGAQNNTFLDSSTNAFSITRNGNTTQGTFSPFSQTGWGNYFDGTGDYLTTNATQAIPATGDFTIEAWVYPTTSGPGRCIVSQGTAGTSGRTQLSVHTDNTLQLGITSTIVYSTGTVTPNAWNYVAVTRTGSSVAFYINGAAAGTTTLSGTVQNTTLTIGGEWNNDPYRWLGYISNVRISNVVRTITAAPTAAFTSDANTVVLTCQSNRFIDNSTNAYTITPNGDVSVQAFSPFNPTAAWSAATNGGSGYFDGSGDYLSIANNSAFALNAPSGNTNDFTVEFWAYPTTTGITEPIGTTYSGSNYWAFAFNRDTGGGNTVGNVQFYMTDSFALTGTGLVASQWNHIAAVRTSTTVSLFVNGSRVATLTSSVNPAPTGALQMGKDTVLNRDYTGYIASARIVTGSTQPYSASASSITVPTSPNTAITGTQVLYSLTNAGIYDATSKNDLETVGNAQISTTQSKFGGSSMYFDGTGDWLLVPTSAQFGFGTGDFTVECWVYPTAFSAVQAIVDARPSNSATPWALSISATGLARTYDGSTVRTGGQLTAAAWNHVAWSRSAGTNNVYVNGVLGHTWSASTDLGATKPLTIGAGAASSGETLTGYIDDLRITKGIARYTSNFTPPTTAFPVL